MNRILLVVQARIASTRLPGKVLLPLAGEPLLAQMFERVTAASTPVEAVVATTVSPADDAIAALCRRRGIDVMRGHPTDLLDRHFQAGLLAKADVVVKIPSDCPLVDPGVVDRVLSAWVEAPCDYASNLHPASYPDGNDVEVMTMAALERAWLGARQPHEREHTTPYFWEEPGRFAVRNVTWETGRDLSASVRLTIDYPEDYALIQAVYDALWTPTRPIFGLEDILSLLEAHPEVAALNAQWRGTTWYARHLEERRIALGEARATETRA